MRFTSFGLTGRSSRREA